MIAGLKPYTEYRDSGLPWLGQVPAHWEVRRIKSVLREVDRRSAAGVEPLLSLRMQAGLVDHHALGGRPIPPSALVGYKRVLPGEIVMNRMRASAGLFAAARTDGLVSPDYAIFRSVGLANVAYLVELFRTPALGAIFRLESTGLGTGESGFLRLYSDQFGRLAIPIPPVAEQAAIVRFLDWANGRLEKAIRAKRKVIALLVEQKQAVIQRAVTRGLDSGALLKSSGIPWLGEIPIHREVRRLGRAISVLTGYPFASAEFVRHEGAVRLLRGVNVTPSGVRWSEVVRWQRRPGDRLERFELQVGDIVLGMDRPVIRAGVRATSLEATDTPSLLLQRVARMRPTENLQARFLLLLLRGGIFSEYILPIFTGISVPHLSPEQIKAFKVALPPTCEQEAIADSIEVSTAGIASTVARIEREIDLLREYRTRLVADVVTGKLDVLEVASRLPKDAATGFETEPDDEADEPEFIDEEVTEA